MSHVRYVLATAKTEKDREDTILSLENYVLRTAEHAIQQLQTAERLIGQGQIIEAEENFQDAEARIKRLQEDGYEIPTPPYLEKVRRCIYTPNTLPTFLREARQLSEQTMLGAWDYFKDVIYSARICGLELPDPEYSETMRQSAHGTLYGLLSVANYAVSNPMGIVDRRNARGWFRDAKILRKEAEENGVEFPEDIIRVFQETLNRIELSGQVLKSQRQLPTKKRKRFLIF